MSMTMPMPMTIGSHTHLVLVVLEVGVEGAVCVLDHIQGAEEERLILQTNVHVNICVGGQMGGHTP